MKLLEHPVWSAVFVAVAAALGYLGLNAAFGGIETVELVTAPLVGIGGAIGYHFGKRRSERRRRRQ